MHKRFGTAVVLLFIATFALVSGLLDRCVAFLLIGTVPYTDITLPPVAMLIFYALFLALGVLVMANQLFIATSPTRREAISRDKARRKIHKLVKTRKTSTSAKTKKRYQPIVLH